MSYQKVVCSLGAVFLTCGAVLASASQDQPIVSAALLEKAGLAPAWSNVLPLKANEYVAKVFSLGDKVYCLTSSNYLFALDRSQGSVAFGTQIALPDLPVSDGQLYRNTVLFMSGSDLIEVNTPTGLVTKSKLKDRAACPPVRNKTNLYVSGTDRRLHVYDLGEHVKRFDATAENDALIVSVFASEDYVVFATQAGDIVRMGSESPTLTWQYNFKGSILAPFVHDANNLYVPSLNTNLYKIRTSDGHKLWVHQCSGPLKTSPLIGTKLVYQYVFDRGIAAIDKETGVELWAMPSAVAVLAEAGGKTFCFDDGHNLLVVAGDKGTVLQRVNFAAVQMMVSSARDERIIVADRSGRIACITSIK